LTWRLSEKLLTILLIIYIHHGKAAVRNIIMPFHRRHCKPLATTILWHSHKAIVQRKSIYVAAPWAEATGLSYKMIVHIMAWRIIYQENRKASNRQSVRAWMLTYQ